MRPTTDTRTTPRRTKRCVRELIAAQRAVVVQLRNEGSISSDVMHRVERELDLEETRLQAFDDRS